MSSGLQREDPPAEEFAIIYDLRAPDAFERARRDRRLWGALYTDIHTVDNDHIVLAFRPRPDSENSR